MTAKKRFIAGATCPACHRVDTIFTLRDEDQQSRHCVKCDFSEQFSEEPAQNVVSQWQPVRLSKD